jgi:ppGpp synthetase/RelA/SpoT-type nucleotidyltranferase
MADLEEARRRWLEDRPRFAAFGEELTRRLKAALKKNGIWGEVVSRGKDMDSLIRKLIKKPDHTYESLGDKCGVRIIVRYKSEIEAILKLAQSAFHCGEPKTPSADSIITRSGTSVLTWTLDCIRAIR